MFCDITPRKLRPPRDSDAMDMENKKNGGPIATKRTIWKYAHANFDQVNEMLSNVDWESVLDSDDVNKSVANWERK